MGRNFQPLNQRFNAAGRRMYRRAIRGFAQFHRTRGGMRTISAVARRRLFGTPLAAAAPAAAVTAGEALLIYATYFSVMNWILFKLGVDKFIARHTSWKDWSLGKDDVPKAKEDNNHPNNMFGDGQPIAPCMPSTTYPNSFTAALGSPIASS